MKRRGFLKMIGWLIGAAALPAVAKRAENARFIVHDIDTRSVMLSAEEALRRAFAEARHDLVCFGSSFVEVKPNGEVRRITPKDWPKL